jgi:peroxiredoxin
VELQKKYRDRGFQVIGISLDDDVKAVPPFYRDYKMNYPVAVGDAKLAESFGNILGLPVNFLIDRDGRIAARHLGEADIPQLEDEIESLLRVPADSTKREK